MAIDPNLFGGQPLNAGLNSPTTLSRPSAKSTLLGEEQNTLQSSSSELFNTTPANIGTGDNFSQSGGGITPDQVNAISAQLGNVGSPTGLNFAGTAAGAATGAVVGSVLPVVGTAVGAGVGAGVGLILDVVSFGVSNYLNGKATERKIKALKQAEKKAIIRRTGTEQEERRRFNIDLGFRERSEQRGIEDRSTQKRVDSFQRYTNALSSRLNKSEDMMNSFVKNGYFPRR
jgi:hypothetical protein